MQAVVPAGVADLTSTWLDEALATSAVLDVSVGSMEVEPLDDSVGFMGDLARLHVEYHRGTGPSTMIVKLPTADPGGRRVGSMLRAWAREVAFYREVAPASAGAKVPRCFHTGADDEAGRWAVVLEDIPADPVDTAVGPSADQAVSAVEALADFHGAWWGDERRFPWMPGFDTTGVGGLQPLWLDALPLFFERYGHLVPEPTGRWLEQFAPTLEAWSAKAAGEPLTVVHADYRLDNLLFVGGEVTMIDWQTALRGPGAMDLTSFIITSLTVEQRRATEAELIGRYLDRLASVGISVDPAWFADSYDENILWWMGQFANNLARLEPDDQNAQRALDTMIERTFGAALDRDVGRLLR